MSIRYTSIFAILGEDDELIPIWDKRVQYKDSDMYGEQIKIEDEYKHAQLVECIFDIKEKTISTGVPVDIYPTENAFKVGDTVYCETKRKHRYLSETEVADIKYKNYKLDIKKGRDIDSWYIKEMKIPVVPDMLYSLKIWEPTYILKNGYETKWEHELYHKD